MQILIALSVEGTIIWIRDSKEPLSYVILLFTIDRSLDAYSMYHYWRCFACCGKRRQRRVNKTKSVWAKLQKVNKPTGSQSGRTVRSRRPAQPSWRSSDWCCCSGLPLHWPGSGGPGCEDLQVEGKKSTVLQSHTHSSKILLHPSAADAPFNISTKYKNKLTLSV